MTVYDVLRRFNVIKCNDYVRHNHHHRTEVPTAEYRPPFYIAEQYPVLSCLDPSSTLPILVIYILVSGILIECTRWFKKIEPPSKYHDLKSFKSHFLQFFTRNTL